MFDEDNDKATQSIQTDRAWALIEMRRYQDAMSLIMDNLRASPDDSYHHCTLAFLQLRLNNINDAIKSAQNAIRLDPNMEWPHRLLAEAYLTEKNFTRALEHAQTAIRIDPENSHGYYINALAEHHNGHLGKAIQALEAAIKLNPEDSDYHELMGSLYFNAQKYKKAEPHYMEALRHNPEDPSIYHHLGFLYSVKGQPVKAADYYYNAVKLDPGNQDYREDLFNLLHHDLLDAPLQHKTRFLQQFDPAIQLFYTDALGRTDWSKRLRITSIALLWTGFILLLSLLMSLVLGDDIGKLSLLIALVFIIYLVVLATRFFYTYRNKRHLKKRNTSSEIK